MSKKLTIWIDEPVPFEEALDIMDDAWIDNAQYCMQTVIDLRDTCKHLLKKLGENNE